MPGCAPGGIAPGGNGTFGISGGRPGRPIGGAPGGKRTPGGRPGGSPGIGGPVGGFNPANGDGASALLALKAAAVIIEKKLI